MFHVELSDWLSRPRAEALRWFRVVIAGPPNAGKSTLFNALVEDDAAIITPLAGTTRDILMRPVSLGGVPFQFLDTAGLRDDGADVVESIGIERAREVMARADLSSGWGRRVKGRRARGKSNPVSMRPFAWPRPTLAIVCPARRGVSMPCAKTDRHGAHGHAQAGAGRTEYPSAWLAVRGSIRIGCDPPQW
jgi:tRNA modification GTPase